MSKKAEMYSSTPDGYWFENGERTLTATIHRPMSGRTQWRICYAACSGKFAPWQGKVEDRTTLAAIKMRINEVITGDARPHGETEYGFWTRVGRDPSKMTHDDFQRACAYEYLAGGDRRDKLVARGLGTKEQRSKYWESVVVPS